MVDVEEALQVAKAGDLVIGDAICTFGDNKQSERCNKITEKILINVFVKFDHGNHVGIPRMIRSA